MTEESRKKRQRAAGLNDFIINAHNQWVARGPEKIVVLLTPGHL